MLKVFVIIFLDLSKQDLDKVALGKVLVLRERKYNEDDFLLKP